MKRELNNCPICFSDDYYQVATEVYIKDYFKISKCRNCGTLFTSYRSKDYNKELFINESKREMFNKKYSAIVNEKKPHDKDDNYLEQMFIIKKYVNKGILLDIGCHLGWLLNYLKKNTKLELYGLEPNAIYAKSTSERLGIKVYNNHLIKGILNEEMFDFISMIDVFEHLSNPNESLLVIWHSLKKNGKLLIKVPNSLFTLLKYHLKKYFSSLIHSSDVFNAKSHHVHYSKGTLKFIIEKNGFRIIEFLVPKPVQTAGSKKIIKQMRGIVYFLGKIGLFPPQDLLIVAEKV